MVYGTLAAKFKTVYFWVNKFKCGCRSTNHEPRPSLPKAALTKEAIHKNHDIFMNDYRLKLNEIADMVNILKQRVGHEMHEEAVITMGAAFTYSGSQT